MKKIQRFQLLLPLLFFFAGIHAQENADPARNAIYAEFTKLRPVYSLNFERSYLRSKTTQYSFRAGLSLRKEEVFIPLGLALLKGNRPNQLEISLVCGPYFRHYSAMARGVDDVDTYLYIQPSLGYRYQRWKAGPFIRLRVAPSISLDIPSRELLKTKSETHTMAFFSVGYSF